MLINKSAEMGIAALLLDELFVALPRQPSATYSVCVLEVARRGNSVRMLIIVAGGNRGVADPLPTQV